MADLLLTSQSSFSLLAAILRVGITFGVMKGCHHKLTVSTYEKTTGNFSLEELKSALSYSGLSQVREFVASKLKHELIDECYLYEKNKEIWNSYL